MSWSCSRSPVMGTNRHECDIRPTTAANMPHSLSPTVVKLRQLANMPGYVPHAAHNAQAGGQQHLPDVHRQHIYVWPAVRYCLPQMQGTVPYTAGEAAMVCRNVRWQPCFALTLPASWRFGSWLTHVQYPRARDSNRPSAVGPIPSRRVGSG